MSEGGIADCTLRYLSSCALHVLWQKPTWHVLLENAVAAWTDDRPPGSYQHFQGGNGVKKKE